MRLLLWAWMWTGWYPGLATTAGWVLFTQARPTVAPPVAAFLALPVASWFGGLVLIGALA